MINSYLPILVILLVSAFIGLAIIVLSTLWRGEILPHQVDAVRMRNGSHRKRQTPIFSPILRNGDALHCL